MEVGLLYIISIMLLVVVVNIVIELEMLVVVFISRKFGMVGSLLKVWIIVVCLFEFSWVSWCVLELVGIIFSLCGVFSIRLDRLYSLLSMWFRWCEGVRFSSMLMLVRFMLVFSSIVLWFIMVSVMFRFIVMVVLFILFLLLYIVMVW